MIKRLLIALALIGILFLLVPVFHVISRYVSEDTALAITPAGYLDDASRLNRTQVDTIIRAEAQPAKLEKQLQDLLLQATQQGKKVSIAGARHSMGGHTLYPDGIVLDMTGYRKMELEEGNHVLRVGSGASWREVLEYLDQFGLSVPVMQSFSNFSIGGSLSVNGHGWQHNSAPISSGIESFRLLLADGTIRTCSRNENQELFSLVIGGYGLFGVILDVRLKVVPNESLIFQGYRFPSAQYIEYFSKHVDGHPEVRMVYGRLNVSDQDFLEEATLNLFLLHPDSTLNPAPMPSLEEMSSATEFRRAIFRSTVNSEYGKRLRWDLETGVGEFSEGIFTRNELLGDDASLVENRDSNSTDILHEYFIPRSEVPAYIEGLKSVLRKPGVDLLNITLRNVYPDKDSYMPYAREEVFGFVMLFNQPRTQAGEAAMQAQTKALVDWCQERGGTYYLPYRLHVSPEQMREFYPQANQFFSLKTHYDPDTVFQNYFYLHYAQTKEE